MIHSGIPSTTWCGSRACSSWWSPPARIWSHRAGVDDRLSCAAQPPAMRITLVIHVLVSALALASAPAAAQPVEQGRKSFESRCARCHGADGNGGEMGPSITRRLPPLDRAALEKLIRDGVP